ncbi:hypothetical protein [Rhodoferax antarcticus]|uniref:Uncharacterized protein n=1 Tax=Rhodoferax antarcticus ANT.BR TaxID=1111071 RepID=A0A1Q8YKB2_9BURK|nr:hypothetical protein [Rhodoferax antarcticus]MCW2311917.1 hypothetical protein [Rhodoferax antarcticus]OLP08369.1 hypothetical protein BLL52_0371 [Rhodoferax antarcticus ANT.BR]
MRLQFRAYVSVRAVYNIEHERSEAEEEIESQIEWERKQSDASET